MGTNPDITPSVVTPIVNFCAAVLSPADFADLLQSSNIEYHSAIYWANNKLEALSAFTRFISKLSSGCHSDLRTACTVASNHASFMQLNLGRTIGPDDKPLRRSLGCLPDYMKGIMVHWTNTFTSSLPCCSSRCSINACSVHGT
ncbi:hypothetical protein K503DRAFT_165305 [Rhizopogon vinicolor AM-OR11-026]|uniref:Uncharacterized protein n=1 Tax=Rhizopogon vinicolor AM-OR11-026 TaxID=1314800 RepID=A0A1B7N0L2_9AGAM|nr:hypothetical protein K503DRAFT_165305 [Rhizopogon vinicolor AM-OR11-026]